MKLTARTRVITVVGTAMAISLTLAATARAQAWPAPQGTGAVTFSTQVVENTGHRMSDGYLLRDGKSRTAGVSIEADYALTDRLSISGGIPYVFAKYVGPGPSLANLPVDACRCWNSGWQDVSASVRYTVLSGDFALTPLVAIGAPSRDYPFEGEAVVGFGLAELRVAADAGIRLTAISSRLAVHARYAYAVVEDVANVPNNRSNWSVSSSAALAPRWSVRGGASWQRTHGGLRIGSPTGTPFPPPGEVDTPELFQQHDRLLRDNSWRLDVGTSYALPAIDLFASYLHFMDGTDTHAGRAFSAGMSVPFRLR